MKKCIYCHKRIKRSEAHGWLERIDNNRATSSPGYSFRDIDWPTQCAVGETIFAHWMCMRVKTLEIEVCRLEKYMISEERIEKLIKDKINEDTTSEW